jgi:hypothetical protein
MSKISEALSTIENEIAIRDRAVTAAYNSADKSVRTLYELRLHIETEQKRKKPSDQILAEVLAKLIPLTPDGPNKGI